MKWAALLNAKSSGFEVFQFLFSIPNSRNKIDSNYDFGSFVCIERCSCVCVSVSRRCLSRSRRGENRLEIRLSTSLTHFPNKLHAEFMFRDSQFSQINTSEFHFQQLFLVRSPERPKWHTQSVTLPFAVLSPFQHLSASISMEIMSYYMHKPCPKGLRRQSAQIPHRNRRR